MVTLSGADIRGLIGLPTVYSSLAVRGNWVLLLIQSIRPPHPLDQAGLTYHLYQYYQYFTSISSILHFNIRWALTSHFNLQASKRVSPKPLLWEQVPFKILAEYCSCSSSSGCCTFYVSWCGSWRWRYVNNIPDNVSCPVYLLPQLAHCPLKTKQKPNSDQNSIRNWFQADSLDGWVGVDFFFCFPYFHDNG